MNWQGETYAMWKERVTTYHPWFAWYPVMDQDGVWHWLERVERYLDMETSVSHFWRYRSADV